MKKNEKKEKAPKKQRKLGRRLLRLIVILIVLGVLTTLLLNTRVKSAAKDRILPPEQAEKLSNVDCILVLGCMVMSDEKPSNMLHDRLQRGIELYENGAAPKLLMSGDHGTVQYDEVHTMKQFALDAGVKSEDVFMDHAGFDTYDSLYRARDIFGAKKIIIVTQEYHLYRALYIAEKLGLDAYGVDAAYRTYSGQRARDMREVLARVKAVGSCLFRVDPACLGDPIPITGDGNLTNDDKPWK